MSNIIINRGELFVDLYDANSVKTGERYFGLTNDAKLNIANETFPIYSTERVLRTLAEEPVIQTTITGDFVAEETSFDNLALLFSSSVSSVTQTASAVTEELVTSSLSKDRAYVVGSGSGVRGMGSVTVKSGSGSVGAATTATLNTDYTIDQENGRIIIPSTSGLTAGHKLWVTYTPTANARSQIAVSGGAIATAALRMISYPAQGPAINYYMPKAQVIANGDFILKGDENQKLNFQFKSLKLNSVTPLLYIDGTPVAS